MEATPDMRIIMGFSHKMGRKKKKTSTSMVVAKNHKNLCLEQNKKLYFTNNTTNISKKNHPYWSGSEE